MTENYTEPVVQLLTMGETNINDDRDYLGMGFTREHIPELIRMVEDEILRSLPVDEKGTSRPETYAQVHAWRVLAQLGAVEAIPALLGLLHFLDDENDDFVDEEIPEILGKLGQAAIEPCRAYLADQENGQYARGAVALSLSEIGLNYPENREACVQALISSLENYENDDETVNAFTLSYLSDLKSVEAAPLAEEMFAAGCVDESIAGDFENYQIRVGLLEERLTPWLAPRLPFPSLGWERELHTAVAPYKPQLSKEKAKKEKAKAKQAKKARKKNKKR
ncbi:MAG: DUF1186 domain-containing protein [Chloroflexi bacterium]|nr:DUF1186 domain-containing protein [Chloroflexota bacterium]